jgi:hypothetical protein
MGAMIRICSVAICFAIAPLLLATSSAGAKPKPITGKLSKPGYTVIALSASGRARSVQAKHGRFRVKPPAKRVTLHLRASDGTYAGPIVVGREGKRAIVGVIAGAHLGKVIVKANKGYAKVKGRLPRGSIDAGRTALAKKGVPIGAGNFGLVRSQHAHGPAADRDLDGIPAPLDIDDDGDLILDNIDRSSAGQRARAAQSADEVGLSSGLTLNIQDTVNANAAALSTRDIDAALSRYGVLKLAVLPGDSAELDCGAPVPAGLPYCAPGGTGFWAFSGAAGAPPPPFPSCCDRDGDGFGTMTPAGGGPRDFFLLPAARSDQIGAGDVVIERVTTGGVESQFPSTLQYVFDTVPALVSYSDGAGHSATLNYPVTPGAPGTIGSGFPVSPSAGGDIVLTLSFWRPQRRPIPPETGQWIDIGHLLYAVPRIINLEGPPPQPSTMPCPQSAFSTADPNLTPSPGAGGGSLKDSAADQSANPANTVTYSLNVTQCLATTGLPWDPGHELQFQFQAGDGTDVAQQAVFFRRP